MSLFLPPRRPLALHTSVGVRPSNNIVAFDGDSRTIQGLSSGSLFARSYPHWLRLLSDQRIATTATLILGAAGRSSDEVLASVPASIATLQAASASTVFLLVGTNDIGNVSTPDAAASAANIGAIIDAYRAAGIVVIAIAETPRGDLSGAYLVHHQGIRDYYLSRHRPSAGVYVVDPWTALAGSANRISDLVHLSVTGCRVLAEQLLGTVRVLFSPASILPTDNGEWSSGELVAGQNVLSNALLSGGSSIATSWSVTNNAGGTTTATPLKVTTSTGEWQQIVVNGTPSGAGELFVRLEQSIDTRAGLFGSGDILDGMIEVEVDAGLSGVRSLELIIVTDNNPRDGAYDSGGTEAEYMLSSEGYTGILRVLPRVLTATPTLLRMRLRAVGLTGVPMAITFRARKAKITKLAS